MFFFFFLILSIKHNLLFRNFEIPMGNHAEVSLQTDVMTKQLHCHGIWSVYNILNFQEDNISFHLQIHTAINIWVNMCGGGGGGFFAAKSCRFDLCWWYHATVELWKIVHMVNRVLTLEHLHYIDMHSCFLTSNTIWWLRLWLK